MPFRSRWYTIVTSALRRHCISHLALVVLKLVQLMNTASTSSCSPTDTAASWSDRYHHSCLYWLFHLDWFIRDTCHIRIMNEIERCESCYLIISVSLDILDHDVIDRSNVRCQESYSSHFQCFESSESGCYWRCFEGICLSTNFEKPSPYTCNSPLFWKVDQILFVLR